MISERRRKKVKKVLFIFLVLWFFVSAPVMYQLNLESMLGREISQNVEKLKEMAEQNIKMAQRAIEMAGDLVSIVQEWRNLAYRLNAEMSLEKEKEIRKYYQRKEKQSGGEWTDI